MDRVLAASKRSTVLAKDIAEKMDVFKWGEKGSEKKIPKVESVPDRNRTCALGSGDRCSIH
jgi:hypothetical protein